MKKIILPAAAVFVLLSACAHEAISAQVGNAPAKSGSSQPAAYAQVTTSPAGNVMGAIAGIIYDMEDAAGTVLDVVGEKAVKAYHFARDWNGLDWIIDPETYGWVTPVQTAQYDIYKSAYDVDEEPIGLDFNSGIIAGMIAGKEGIGSLESYWDNKATYSTAFIWGFTQGLNASGCNSETYKLYVIILFDKIAKAREKEEKRLRNKFAPCVPQGGGLGGGPPC